MRRDAISALAAVAAVVDNGGSSQGSARGSTGPRGLRPQARCRWTVTVEREGVVMVLGYVFFRSPICDHPLFRSPYLRLTPSQISIMLVRIGNATMKAALDREAR